MAQPTYNYIDYIYTALRADDSRLSLVIFTNDPNAPEKIGGKQVAYIIYVEGLTSTPSAQITLRWVSKIEKSLCPNTHLIHDSGGEFISKTSQNDFRKRKLFTHQIPPAGGAYCNPLDNTFHHDMKHHYYPKPRTCHTDMLKAMAEAYYEVPSTNIQHYFRHCRIIGKPMTRTHTTHLLNEGYRPGRGHAEIHRLCRNAYAAWQKNIRFVNSNVRPNAADLIIPDDHLDGVYWHPHCNN